MELSDVPEKIPSDRGVAINPLNAEINPICHLLALLETHHILHVSRIGVKSACQTFSSFYCNCNTSISSINPLNAEINPICHLLALLGAHHILHVSRIRVNIVNILLC
jgi:hypothetical protein